MFSQFRQAVESLAPRSSLDGPSVESSGPEATSRPGSLDSQSPVSSLSSSQLAESALLNLRKSLATQRSGSQSTNTRHMGIAQARTKSTLEDRLRAVTSNAISLPEKDATPSSPMIMTVTTSRPLSPLSIPLPDSPINSLHLESAVSSVISDHAISPPMVNTHSLSEIPPSASNPIEQQTEASQDSQKLEESQDAVSQMSKIYQSMQNNSNAVSEDHVHVADSIVEELQKRLKQVEQRFTDVSTSFKKLQTEKTAADLVLQELSPLKGIQDSSALREFLQNISVKSETFQREIKRLNIELETQESRIDELKSAHQSEFASQSNQIEKLHIQLNEAEALVAVGQRADIQAEENAATRKAEIDGLLKELDRAKLLAKEEEEKRVKAISLLKTVRQKLVKAEKERDDALRDTTLLKEKDRSEKDKEEGERLRLRAEVEGANREREKAIADLLAQFDKDVANVKDRHDREITVTQRRFELEIVTTKSTYDHELAAKSSRIYTLEQTLTNITKEKNAFFDSLQLRQAELESAQSHLESLQSQNTELLYQLREIEDRYALLKEDFAEVQREQEARLREPTPSADEVAHLLSTNEAKYEAKISVLKKNLDDVEKERNENEAEWSRKLRDKSREVEESKKAIRSAVAESEHHEEIVAALKGDIGRLESESRLLQGQLSELRHSNLRVKDAEKLWKAREADLDRKITTLEGQVDESKQQETKLRLGNKTLREELQKVQSSAALLERQRHPGVGYRTSHPMDNRPTENQTSLQSNPASRVASPVPSLAAQWGDEVSLEYLRNVVLQFLENKEMRPNLVKVLSIILHFTPQETRRLVAKI